MDGIKSHVDYGHSFYMADDVRSFSSASSDNDSCMDSGEIGALLRELRAAICQIPRSKGVSDLGNDAHSKDDRVAIGTSGSKLGPDSDIESNRKMTCDSGNGSNLKYCLDFYVKITTME